MSMTLVTKLGAQAPPSISYSLEMLRAENTSVAKYPLVGSAPAAHLVGSAPQLKGEPCSAKFSRTIDKAIGLIDKTLSKNLERLKEKRKKVNLAIKFQIYKAGALKRLKGRDNPNSFACQLVVSAVEYGSGAAVDAGISRYNYQHDFMEPPLRLDYNDEGHAHDLAEFMAQDILYFLYPKLAKTMAGQEMRSSSPVRFSTVAH